MSTYTYCYHHFVYAKKEIKVGKGERGWGIDIQNKSFNTEFQLALYTSTFIFSANLSK
jgi:hypothetical protein